MADSTNSEVGCNKCKQTLFLELEDISDVAFEFWNLDILQPVSISAAGSSSADQHGHLTNMFSFPVDQNTHFGVD